MRYSQSRATVHKQYMLPKVDSTDISHVVVHCPTRDMPAPVITETHCSPACTLYQVDYWVAYEEREFIAKTNHTITRGPGYESSYKLEETFTGSSAKRILADTVKTTGVVVRNEDWMEELQTDILAMGDAIVTRAASYASSAMRAN